MTTFLQSGSDPGCCHHLCSRGSGPLAPAPCYSARTLRRLRRPCWQTQLESTWISRGSSRSSAVSRMLRSRRLSAEYSSHSFRAAISSALAKFPFLVSEDEIKCWGRWDSAAFKKYTRLKSDQRLALHGKVTSALLFRPPFCNGRGGSPV